MGAWSDAIEAQAERIANPEPIVNRIVDEVILGPNGMLARNYHASGLNVKSGLLFDGITRRGWIGNYVRVDGTKGTVGLDLRAISYAKWALEGRGPVTVKKAKALAFYIDGKLYFRKRVGPAPPHDVYHLSADFEAQAQAIQTEMMEQAVRDGEQGIPVPRG